MMFLKVENAKSSKLHLCISLVAPAAKFKRRSKRSNKKTKETKSNRQVQSSMLGLVADYSSDDETTATISTTTTPQTTTTTTTTQTTSIISSSSETNNNTTITSSLPPLPPATIETNTTTTSTVTYDEQQQVKKRKTTKKTRKIQKNKKNKNGNGGSKRKRTTLEIVSALGLDQEMDNILRHDHSDDDDDYDDNDMKSSKRQKTTSIDMENRHENDNDDDAIVGVYGDGNVNVQRQEHKGNSSSSALLSDDFFDTLHEYREREDDNVHGQLSHHYGGDDGNDNVDDTVNSEEVVGPLIMEQQPSYDHTYNQNLQQQQQQTVIEINAMNRGDAYLSEATKRQIAIEKHRNLTASSLSGSGGGATSTQKVISNVQRSRNQLSYLAHSAQVNELENAEKIAEGRANKRAAWKKYGWT